MKKISVALAFATLSLNALAGNGWCDRSKNPTERERCYQQANQRIHKEIQGYLNQINASSAPETVKDELYNKANATAKAIREQCVDSVCVYNTATTLKNNLLVASGKYK